MAEKLCVPRVCRKCGVSFLARPSAARLGLGHFCSRRCYDGRQVQSLEERFWKKVRKGDNPDDCWIWTGATAGSGSGYGWIGACQGSKAGLGAHRVSWEIHNGPIPDGLCVLHNCPTGDNPRCVNPNHLWLGTRKQNTRDMFDKARDGFARHPERRARGERSGRYTKPESTVRGERSGKAKLTSETVRWIRRRYDEGGMSQRAIADELGISEGGVAAVVHRRTWKHVE